MRIVILIFVALISTCRGKIDFSDRARNFSVELLYFTAEETQWHTVISPFGVWSLLTAASIGATDSSREQLVRTLILPKKRESLINGYKSLVASVLKPGTRDVTLKSQNYLFVDNGLSIKETFVQNIRNDFHATFNKMSFSPSEEAQRYANGVIQNSKITDYSVLKAEDFENSRMILTNVISFKATWQLPFNESETKVENFYDENGNVVGKVNMMFQQESFSYSKVDEIRASVLELPYGHDDTSKYSFLIFLPYAGETVASVYNNLDQISLQDIFLKLNTDTDYYGLASVLVSLPRFKISTNLILNKPLTRMGIVDIFDSGTASFKSMTEGNDIFISAIVHKADIEVTEVGTEASAFTSAFFADRIKPSTFKANKPFIYYVVEKTTATIIFSGVYSKPSIF
ncbi:serine protease inhibitor 77Ba-like [Battus philenor]|uniref:serine protease inhibitor 77Ba-like n=1 Tax=Battus philenor TaxID=42288 RepID=UPI0035CFD46F